MHRSLAPVLAVIFACGPVSPEDTTAATVGPSSSDGASTGSATSTTTDPTSTTAATAGTTTSTTSEPGTTTSPGTLTEPDTTTTTTTTTTGPGTTTTTTGPDTTTTTGPDTTGTTGAPGDAQYAAFYLPGGLDRILVRKFDADADLCTSVIFVWPGTPPPGLTLPKEWGLQWAQIFTGVPDCLDSQAMLPMGVSSDTVTGVANWVSMNFCPKSIDLDIVVTFPPQQPWVPAQDALKAAALPLQGC